MSRLFQRRRVAIRNLARSFVGFISIDAAQCSFPFHLLPEIKTLFVQFFCIAPEVLLLIG